MRGKCSRLWLRCCELAARRTDAPIPKTRQLLRTSELVSISRMVVSAPMRRLPPFSLIAGEAREVFLMLTKRARLFLELDIHHYVRAAGDDLGFRAMFGNSDRASLMVLGSNIPWYCLFFVVIADSILPKSPANSNPDRLDQSNIGLSIRVSAMSRSMKPVSSSLRIMRASIRSATLRAAIFGFCSAVSSCALRKPSRDG